MSRRLLPQRLCIKGNTFRSVAGPDTNGVGHTYLTRSSSGHPCCNCHIHPPVHPPDSSTNQSSRSYQGDSIRLYNWFFQVYSPGCVVVCGDRKKEDAGSKQMWRSSPIIHRISIKLLATSSGTKYHLIGPLDQVAMSTMTKNCIPVSSDIYSKFSKGFPKEWVELILMVGDLPVEMTSSSCIGTPEANISGRIQLSIKPDPCQLNPNPSMKELCGHKTSFKMEDPLCSTFRGHNPSIKTEDTLGATFRDHNPSIKMEESLNDTQSISTPSSLKRKRRSFVVPKQLKKRKPVVMVKCEVSADVKWDEEGVKELRQAVHSVPAITKNFWQKVAQKMSMSYSAAECQSKYMEGIQKPKMKLLRAKNSTARTVQLDPLVEFVRPGTMKSRHQLRNIMSRLDQGYTDDVFETTPLKKVKKTVQIDDEIENYCDDDDDENGYSFGEQVNKVTPTDNWRVKLGAPLSCTPKLSSYDLFSPEDTLRERELADRVMYKIGKAKKKADFKVKKPAPMTRPCQSWKALPDQKLRSIRTGELLALRMIHDPDDDDSNGDEDDEDYNPLSDDDYNRLITQYC